MIIYGIVKTIVFWEVMHCRLIEIDKNFGWAGVF